MSAKNKPGTMIKKALRQAPLKVEPDQPLKLKHGDLVSVKLPHPYMDEFKGKITAITGFKANEILIRVSKV